MINRIVECELLGKKRELCLTIGAQDAIAELCDGLENIEIYLTGTRDVITSHFVNLLAILMKGAYDYKKITAKMNDEAFDETAPPTAEEMAMIVAPGDMSASVTNAIIKTINVGMAVTVDIEADEKNAETTK